MYIKQVLRLAYDLKGHLDSWKFKDILFGLIYMRAKGVIDSFAKCEKNWGNKILHFVNYHAHQLDQRENLGLVDFMDLDHTFRGWTNQEIAEKLGEIFKRLEKINIPMDGDSIGALYVNLIDSFAYQAGRFGGQFFTTKSLTKLIYSVASKGSPDSFKEGTSVLDPTCGSGSLLLQFKDIPGVELCGQEVNFNSSTLARLNMSINNVENYDIRRCDTLYSNPLKSKKFDFVVGNPPFGISWDRNKADPKRFKYGLAPTRTADWAFAQIALDKMKEDGVTLLLFFTGALQRKPPCWTILEGILRDDLLRGVVHLPENMFHGTSVDCVLLIMSKRKDWGKEGHVIFIDHSKQWERHPTKGRMLTDEQITRITNTFHDYKEDINEFCACVPISEVIEQKTALPANYTTENRGKIKMRWDFRWGSYLEGEYY